MNHLFLAPMPPAVANILRELAQREVERARKFAYVCGCLNLRSDETAQLLAERNVGIDTVYERLQQTQAFGACDLSIDYLFGTQEPQP